MSGANLIGRIVASRIGTMISRAKGARVMFAIIDLSPAATSAIASEVAKISLPKGHVQVGVHPDLATGGLDPALVSSDVAVKFRNNRPEDVLATVFSVPASEMGLVIQSLVNVERINEAWLLNGRELDRWARTGLRNAERSTTDAFKNFLKGLLASEVPLSVETLADFVVKVDALMNGPEGLALVGAINRALPVLRLPRESLTPDVLASGAEAQLRKSYEIVRTHFQLQDAKGTSRNVAELRERLDLMKAEKQIEADAAEAIQRLIDEHQMDGRWTDGQAFAAAVPWLRIRPFFEETKAKVRATLGQETIDFLAAHHPTMLTEDVRTTLVDVRSEAGGSNEAREQFFVDNRDLLRHAPKLLKRWERLVFEKPVEADDLLVGLVEVAARAFGYAEEVPGQQAKAEPSELLYVRLSGSETEPFWLSGKNTNLCRFLRDRYRGLGKLLAPLVVLDFGKCWTDWELRLPDGIPNEKASKGAEFEFEAFAVSRAMVAGGKVPSVQQLGKQPKAKLTWKPKPRAFHLAFADDLATLIPKSAGLVHLLSATVSQSRHGKTGAIQPVDLNRVETVTDARGGSRGVLTSPDDPTCHIAGPWLAELADLAEREIVKADHATTLHERFDEFHRLYDQAIRSMADGDGLADASLLDQAEAYGALLASLRLLARQEISVKDLWGPLLQVGTATVASEQSSLIVGPWHPLRLAEMGIKARQAAAILERIVTSSPDAAAGVGDYVKDRARALGSGYYVDAGVIPGSPNAFVTEMARVGDYSLLAPPGPDGLDILADEPARDTVKAFGKIADQYLKLKPHEAANFSAVLIDAESEDLPVMMAGHLARQIEGEADLRCDLVVTHSDPVKLRTIYERQNRRIGHEIDSSLTSEAAKTFLSRLRVGIVSPTHIEGGNPEAPRQNDIVLLQNVIARRAEVSWASAAPPTVEPGLATHFPCDVSRRRPYSRGDVRAGVYLTAPDQPAACRAYVDAVCDVHKGRASDAAKHNLPMLEVNFGSDAIKERLKQAHALGNWVMTFDRIADRRLISSADNLRVLRYYSPPRAVHNVIVSTEISRQSFRERLRSDIGQILPGSADDALDVLIDDIRKRSASLSGGIVMRGAQWENYAKELFGVVVAQRQLELMFDAAGPNETAWFFLDDFKGWLDLSGEIADILAVNLVVGPDGPRVRMTVVEAKCVGQNSLGDMRTRSMRQLEKTYDALVSRFTEGEANVEPAIWRNRLADMILEHIDPFNRVGDIEFDGWIDGLRRGLFPLEISGHSVVLVHDALSLPEDGPIVPDEAKDIASRRRLVQWVFGGDVIRKSLAELRAENGSRFLFETHYWPAWPGVSQAMQAQESSDYLLVDAPPPTDEQADVKAQTDGAPAVEGRTDDLKPGQTSEPASDATPTAFDEAVPPGWLPEIHSVVRSMAAKRHVENDQAWLDAEVAKLRRSLQAEGMNAAVLDARLTPNSGLVQLDGSSVSVGWLEKNQKELATKHHLDLIRVTPMIGRIALAIRRPKRATLHLAQAWLKRLLGPEAPRNNLSPLIGEREEDGALFYLPLAGSFGEQERAAPHSIISGTTGSGKGILATSLILDVCAFNAPNLVDLHLIDPKRGVDYVWVKRLPHLKRGIVDTKDGAIELFKELVEEMERRYERLQVAECANIDQYNKAHGKSSPMPRILVFFDEVANWMQDDEFKDEVEPLLNEIATKSRAAGIHLTMIYQRADNQVMTMQLRTNLGNKLVLRLSDEGSSKIVLNEKGAEKLLGKGHLIAVLDSGDKIFGQVPFLEDDEVKALARSIEAGWANWPGATLKEAAE